MANVTTTEEILSWLEDEKAVEMYRISRIRSSGEQQTTVAVIRHAIESGYVARYAEAARLGRYG